MSSNRHTLRRVFINKTWLGSVRQICLVVAWLGLASVRLYYTAPYRFLVSMFRVPVLVHWLGLGLGWVRPRLNITRMHHRHHTISLKGMQHHTISLVADKIRKDVLLIKQGPTLSSSNTPFFTWLQLAWFGLLGLV